MRAVPTFLSLAIKLAQANHEPKWRLAAVAVSGGRVLSVGINCFQQNSSPPGTIHYQDLGRHAETEALRRCSTVPRTMYVARVNKKNISKLARSCDACYNTMARLGVRQIIYTTDTGYSKEKLWTNNS